MFIPDRGYGIRIWLILVIIIFVILAPFTFLVILGWSRPIARVLIRFVSLPIDELTLLIAGFISFVISGFLALTAMVTAIVVWIQVAEYTRAVLRKLGQLRKREHNS